ncbi:MAG: hypothetical protein RI967_1604 [Planctomycetota bacterium]
MSQSPPTPEKRFLGLDGTPDDRAILALPADGALKSGQVESAFEVACDRVARHPLAGSAEARRLLARLELAADRLQSAIALEGRGPLHPAAARRAAKRLEREAARAAARPAATGASANANAGAAAVATGPIKVVAPTAVARPGAGISASDLTDFDRLALAILVVSGGWNGKSAKRLATVAEEHGVSVADLERVVLGLTTFLSEGEGLRGAMGEVGSAARASWLESPKRGASDAAEGMVERVFGRINDVLRDEVSGARRGSEMRLAVIFSLLALGWMGALGFLFFRPAPAPEVTPGATTAAPELAAAPGEGSGAADRDANGALVAPIDALAAPAKFPRPPGFTPSSPPRELAARASAMAEWIAVVEEAQRTIAGDRGRLGTDGRRALADALSTAADHWPLSGASRVELVRAIGLAARGLRGPGEILDFMRAIPGGDGDTGAAGKPAWQRAWRDAFGAGVLSAIALDASQPPDIAAPAREELRRRALPIARGRVADPFAQAAIQSLGAASVKLAEDLALAIASLEDASRWTEAVDAAAVTQMLRDEAAIDAIDACLRAPGALDKPGALVDFLADSIHRIDFTGRGADAPAVRAALADWVLDRRIPPSRIWVFTSLLDADLGIAWYGPDLVLPTNAGEPARVALAERIDRAFPAVGATAIGEAVLVEKGDLEPWLGKVGELGALGDRDAADLLRNAAAAVELARAARAFEATDAKVAKAAISRFDELATREDREWEASPEGERAGLPASGVDDGEFERAMRATRDAAARVDLVRALGARPAAGDLGPVDARFAANEAIRGSQPEVRQEIALVLSSRYASGPNVLRAVLDALADGTASGDADEFVSVLVGETLVGRGWQESARLAILERLRGLFDGRTHALDLAAAELASSAGLLAAEYGKPGAGPGTGVRADRALALVADAMREEARGRFLATPFPAPISEIERQRAARRSIATGATQRMAAETAAIVDYAAMLVASRQPALASELGERLGAARRARTLAASASAQVESDLSTLVEILAKGLAPAASERDAEAGA